VAGVASAGVESVGGAVASVAGVVVSADGAEALSVEAVSVEVVAAVASTGASAGGGESAVALAVESGAFRARIGSALGAEGVGVAAPASGSAEDLCVVAGSYCAGAGETVVAVDCVAALVASGANPVGSCPTVAVTVGASLVAGVAAVVGGSGALGAAPTVFVSTAAGTALAQFRRAAIAPVRTTDRTWRCADLVGVCRKKGVDAAELVAAELCAAWTRPAGAAVGPCAWNTGNRRLGSVSASSDLTCCGPEIVNARAIGAA
jgi:hypothetical protein